MLVQARHRLPLRVLLARPRGFCAGVDRAVQIVEQTLLKYGGPVYVRHEIVHNHHVVQRLARLGAVFIDDLADAPDDRPLIFSAHGVPKSVVAEARRRNLLYLDATCPLVSKVHTEIRRQHALGRQVILIGHAGHPEVVGAMGQAPDGAVILIETVDDVALLRPSDPGRLAFVTQTTLSVDDAAQITAALQARFPEIIGPSKTDICYATTNRQEAFKTIAGECDLVLVVGSKTSSNSLRLVETALRSGAKIARLIDGAEDIDWSWLRDKAVVGLTAGASSPEALVEKVLDALGARYDLLVKEVAHVRETLTFKLPRALTE